MPKVKPTEDNSYHDVGHIEKNVAFNYTAFFETLVLEASNFFPLSFVVMLLLRKGDVKKAWAELAHREMRLVIGNKNLSSPGAPYILAFFFNTIPWFLVSVKLLGLEGGSYSYVETIVVPAILVLEGNLSIACKYALYPPEDYKRVTCKANPPWTNADTQRRMLLAGWANPEKYKGLLEGLFLDAKKDALVDISKYEFTNLNSRACAVLKEQATSVHHAHVGEGGGFSHFNPGTHVNSESESATTLEAKTLMLGIVFTSFHQPVPVIGMRVVIGSLIVAVLPVICRAVLDQAPIGSGSLSNIAGVYISLIFVVRVLPPWFWARVVIQDNKRRERAYGILGRLMVHPGVRVSELVQDKTTVGVDDDTFVYLNPGNVNNVNSWVMCRNVIRVYGQSFMKRGEAYLTISLLSTVLLLAILCLLIVGGVKHFATDIILLMFILGVRCYGVVQTSLSVSKLNELVTEHREIIRAAKVHLISESTGKELNLQAIHFLSAVDDLVETREQVSQPHKIMGVRASMEVIQSYVSLLASGFLFTFQTFVTSSAFYGADGWFVNVAEAAHAAAADKEL